MAAARRRGRPLLLSPDMDWNHVSEGVLRWLGLVILFTFHEFGHAWMAMKCGDNTAKDEGRVSLNPLVHIDPIGSVLMRSTGHATGNWRSRHETACCSWRRRRSGPCRSTTARSGRS